MAKSLSTADRQMKHREDLTSVMNALVDRRRALVAKAMPLIGKNVLPIKLPANLTLIQSAIDAVARAIVQEDRFREVSHPAQYLFDLPEGH